MNTRDAVFSCCRKTEFNRTSTAINVTCEALRPTFLFIDHCNLTPFGWTLLLPAFPVGVSATLRLAPTKTYLSNCFLILFFFVQYVFILHRPYLSKSIILESCSAVIINRKKRKQGNDTRERGNSEAEKMMGFQEWRK